MWHRPGPDAAEWHTSRHPRGRRALWQKSQCSGPEIRLRVSCPGPRHLRTVRSRGTRSARRRAWRLVETPGRPAGPRGKPTPVPATIKHLNRPPAARPAGEPPESPTIPAPSSPRTRRQRPHTRQAPSTVDGPPPDLRRSAQNPPQTSVDPPARTAPCPRVDRPTSPAGSQHPSTADPTRRRRPHERRATAPPAQKSQALVDQGQVDRQGDQTRSTSP